MSETSTKKQNYDFSSLPISVGYIGTEVKSSKYRYSTVRIGTVLPKKQTDDFFLT